MHTSRVPPAVIECRRFDPDYYHPDHLRQERKLRNARTAVLGSIGKFFAGPFGSKLPSSLYLTEGVPLFRVGNVGSMTVNFDGMAHLSPQVHDELRASEVVPGDLLVVKASVGEKICKVPPIIPRANITQHIIAIRPNGRADVDYIAAFLFGAYGRGQLVRRSLGSIIQYLGIVDAKTVLYPDIDRLAQKYIGDKVRQAERLQERTALLDRGICHQFTSLTQNLEPRRKAWRVSTTLLDNYRINPTQYDYVVMRMLDSARSTHHALIELGSLIGKRGIAGGATPLGASYPDKGVFFVRVQNVKPHRLDLGDAVYLSPEQDQQLARSRCAAQDIVLSITGYPGVAGLVLEEDLPLNINQHCVRFDVNGDFPAEYIVAALNSRFVKMQVDRLAIGGTRDALDYPSVRGLLIPRLPDETVCSIACDITSANRAVKCAHRLLAAATVLVEALVDRELTEAELKATQEALDRDDHGPDREILRRLTRKGIDVPGEPPLFPDLDAVEAAIAEASDATEEPQP